MRHADLNPEEAEDIVIGQILYEPDCISRAARILKAEHFFGFAHQTTFDTALKLWKDGTPVDSVTMVMAMRKAGTLEAVGGAFWLSSRTQRVAQTVHLEHHAAIVREYYGLRVLRDTGMGLMNNATLSADPMSLISDATIELSRAAAPDIDTDVNAGERARAMMDEVKPKPFYLNMSGVDDYVFMLPGNMITISAPSGVGKTAFALSAVLNLVPQLKPWFVSLEMSADELITRAICQLACVDISDALQDRCSDIDKERMALVASEYADIIDKIDIDDSGYMTIDTFKAKAEHKVRNEGVRLIVVDYAQLMEADPKEFKGPAAQNEAISKGLRHTARSLNVILLAVVHLNREGEAHGSTQYEKDAHIRMKLSRPTGANMMTVDFVKNRNGRIGSVDTPCEMRFGLIGRNAIVPSFRKSTPHPDNFIEPIPF